MIRRPRPHVAAARASLVLLRPRLSAGRSNGRSSSCVASGWGLRRSCARSNGTVVCPVCTQLVVTRQDQKLGDGIRLIADHAGGHDDVGQDIGSLWSTRVDVPVGPVAQ